MISYGEVKTMKRNVLLIPNLCLYSQKDFKKGRWSFLGPGLETKWYSICNERLVGEWDKVAELMMIKFGESGHPVFRATSRLSRGTLKSKGGGKLSIHFCADGDTIETVFSHNCFCKSAQYSTEQSQICVKNTVAVEQEQGDLCWQSNLIHFFAPADLLMTTPTPSIEILAQQNLYCKSTENEWKSFHNQIN